MANKFACAAYKLGHYNNMFALFWGLNIHYQYLLKPRWRLIITGIKIYYNMEHELVYLLESCIDDALDAVFKM